MSTNSIYFIPVKAFPVGQFATNAKKVLESLEIIDGYYDEDDDLYASGESIGFEYASIHDTDKNKLIPESSSTGYGATCPTCKADVDDDLYDTINDYYDYEAETGKEKDMSSLTLTCSHCKASATLGSIDFPDGVRLSNQFFQWVNVEDKLEETSLESIEEALGTKLILIYERM